MGSDKKQTKDAPRLPQSRPEASFAERVLVYFYPVHYRFGMEMEAAMGQGVIGRKQAALLWLIYSQAGEDGWLSRKVAERELVQWFEMSPPNVTKVIRDLAFEPHFFIEIIESPISARERHLRLTEDGKVFVNGMIKSAEKFLGERVQHMPAAELDAGLRFLSRAFAQFEGDDGR